MPILTLARAVPLDWTDHNAHMMESKNLEAFVNPTDRFMELIGCDSDYISDSEGADILPPKPMSDIRPRPIFRMEHWYQRNQTTTGSNRGQVARMKIPVSGYMIV